MYFYYVEAIKVHLKLHIDNFFKFLFTSGLTVVIKLITIPMQSVTQILCKNKIILVLACAIFLF